MSTRRSMLLGAPAVIGLAAMPFAEWREAQAQTVRVRRNVTNAATNLDTYRRGVAAMRALPTSDPRNWQNFANIHRDRCQHRHWWFLPWHRIYILRFEEIIRQLTNTPSFALLYWNHFTQRSLPLPFRSPTTNNVLYTSQRSSFANQINPAEEMQLSDVNVRLALETTIFVGNTGFGGPQRNTPAVAPNSSPGRLENTPHNSVHEWVGGENGLMSDRGLAARDPIFWLHHSNIDRLWEVWLRQGGGRANPTNSTWRNQTFTFPGATGTNVTTRVGDVLNIGMLGYSYDDTSAPAATTTTTAMTAAAHTGTTVEAVETVDATRGEAQNVPLGPRRIKKIRLPAGSALTRGGVPSTVVIEGLSGDLQGAIFAVYANLPEGIQPNTEASAPYFVGNIAPFVGGEQGGHAHDSPSFHFEIPPELLQNKSELVLTIVPNPTSETGNVNIGRVRVLRR